MAPHNFRTHTIAAIRRAIPWFNRRAGTEKDFWAICQRENIHVDFWRLAKGVRGFYGINRKYKVPRKYIVIDVNLRNSGDWLLTAFHELAHHFLHAPYSDREVYFSSKHTANWQDDEADMIAYALLIPRRKYIELSRMTLDEICEFSTEDLIRRKDYFDLSNGEI